MISGPFKMTILLGSGDMVILEQPGSSRKLSMALRDKLLSLDLVKDRSEESGYPDLMYLQRMKKEYTRKKLLPIVKETIQTELEV